MISVWALAQRQLSQNQRYILTMTNVAERPVTEKQEFTLVVALECGRDNAWFPI
jgi:hypothetical protein